MNERTQKELYQRAFSRLHASAVLDWEEMNMDNGNKKLRCRRSFLVAAVILSIMMAMSAIAYAATGGEILDSVKVWINGNQVSADTYKQEDGSILIDLQEGARLEISGEGWSTEAESGSGTRGTVKITEEGVGGEKSVETELSFGEDDK